MTVNHDHAVAKLCYAQPHVTEVRRQECYQQGTLGAYVKYWAKGNFITDIEIRAISEGEWALFDEMTDDDFFMVEIDDAFGRGGASWLDNLPLLARPEAAQ